MNLILLVASLVAATFGENKNIPDNVRRVINDVYGAFQAAVASGVFSQVDVNTVLGALAGVSQSLATDNTLPQETLNTINLLIAMARDAAVADDAAQKVVDPTTLGPIEDVV